jgi:hypothetical protein
MLLRCGWQACCSVMVHAVLQFCNLSSRAIRGCQLGHKLVATQALCMTFVPESCITVALWHKCNKGDLIQQQCLVLPGGMACGFGVLVCRKRSRQRCWSAAAAAAAAL